MNDLYDYRLLPLLVAALGQAVFVLLYVAFPWWKTFLGRALFFKAFAFASLLAVVSCGVAFDWAHEQTTFLVLYCALAVGIWYQVFAFIWVLRHRPARTNQRFRKQGERR